MENTDYICGSHVTSVPGTDFDAATVKFGIGSSSLFFDSSSFSSTTVSVLSFFDPSSDPSPSPSASIFPLRLSPQLVLSGHPLANPIANPLGNPSVSRIPFDFPLLGVILRRCHGLGVL